MQHNSIESKLIGKILPPTFAGESGRGLEDLLESIGIPINRGSGVDCLIFDFEVKSRDIDAISPQTVCTMTFNDIIATPYANSRVREKFQRQFRVKTKHNVIISAEMYDFSHRLIQNLIEEAYETARASLAASQTNGACHGKWMPAYVPGTKWGYLENVNTATNSYHFRISHGAMDDFEAMSHSTLSKLFE
jgi:hypothetical protein